MSDAGGTDRQASKDDPKGKQAGAAVGDLRDGLAGEQSQLIELRAARLEWEQRCLDVEKRVRILEQHLIKSSHSSGAELSTLRLEIAKRNAKIAELEFLSK